MAYRRIFPLLVTFLLASSATAAELGEPRVSSYKGQALVADIELSGLDNPAAAVQVRVANPDVYRGASITVPPVLSALTLSVVQKGGKQFVHVTSNRPVDTDMLHLFLELGQGSQRDVRLATLWLTADPRPAPPPVPAPVAVAIPVMEPVVTPIAQPETATPVRTVTLAAPLHLAPVNTALPASVRSAPPASCKASPSSNACAVLDTKNVALQAKLVGLEDKIKLLEATLAPAKGAAAATAMAAAALVPPAGEAHAEPHADTPSIVPPIASIKPAAAPVAVIVAPKKPKLDAPKPSSTPWLWIGVAATVFLAAIGAIVFLLLRRRRNGVPPAPRAPKPGLLAGLKQRFKRSKAAPAEA